MKTKFTNSNFNKTFNRLLAFCAVLLMSINAFAQVTATEDFENEATGSTSFSEGSPTINFTHNFNLVSLSPYGFGGSEKFLEMSQGGAVATTTKTISINAATNPGIGFTINSFAGYVSYSQAGNPAYNGIVSVTGTLVGGGTVGPHDISILSAGTAGPTGIAGQSRDGNGIVSGITLPAAFNGQYFTSLSFTIFDNNLGSGTIGTNYFEIDHINFTTSVASTNTYAIANASFVEGNSSTTVNTYTVTRSVSTAAGSVQIQSSNGTATAGTDYVAVPLTTVNFPIGSLTQTVNVTINGDATIESNETINMTLSNPTGGTIAVGAATITILTDDNYGETFEDETANLTTFSEGEINFQSTGKLVVFKTNANLGAGGSSAGLQPNPPYATGTQGSIQVTSVGKAISMLSVDLWSSAVSGANFPPTACTVTFVGTKTDGTGTVTHTANITPSGTNVYSTVNFAGTEFDGVSILSISFSVSNAANYLNIDNFTFAPIAVGTQVSINDVGILEGTLGSGTTSAVFTVSRTNNTSNFSVNVASSNGTATAGSDYTALTTTTLNFTSGGALSQTVTVPIIKDAANEPNETFNMTLSNATNGTVYLKQVAIGTIFNDDGNVNETFEDETNNATTFTENSVAFSATGGYKVIGSAGGNGGSGASGYFLTSNNNVVGSMGTFSVTTPNTAFKIVSLDAWVGTSTTAFSSGPVTFTGTLFGGGTVSTTKTITATSNTGAGWQQGITFTGTDLDNVNLTALQITTGGSLKACDIDNFNFTVVNTSPVIEVVDDVNVAVTNGAPAVQGGNTDFAVVCLTGRTGSKTFTIKNTGQSNLILSGSPLAVLGGTNASEFSITSQPTSPIAPGGSTTFTVLFDPSVGGAKNVSITLTSNDPTNSPYVINLRGAGGSEPTVTLGASPAICAGATSFTIPFSGFSANPTAYSVSGPIITPVINGSLIGVTSPFVVNLISPAVFGTNVDYTFSIRNGNGCVSPNYTGSVTVTEGPTLMKSASPAICAGATTFTIPYTATTGTPTTYSISGAGITPVTDAALPLTPITVNLISGASGSSISYILTVKSANGCTSSNITGSVTVNTNPTASPSSNTPVCVGNTLNLSSTTATSYLWNGPNSFSSTVQNPSISNVTIVAGGTYTLRVTNAGGCTATATTAVTINSLPIPNPSSNSPKCIGTTLSFNSVAGMSNYLWAGPNSFSSTIQAPSISNVTADAGGTYTLTVTNASGCSASATTSVTINVLPVPNPSSDSPRCVGQTLTFNSVAGMSIYAWTGPNLLSWGVQSPTFSNVSAIANGTYTLTVTDVNGCSASATTAVTINALPVPNPSSDSPKCVGQTLTFNSVAGMTTYAWTGPNSFTGSTQSPSISNVTTAANGTYTLTVTNGNGCTATAQTVVTINSSPAPTSPTATPSNFTVAGTTTLTATGCNSPSTITWYDSANSSVALPNNTPTISANKTFFARCTGTNTCISSPSTNVSVTYNPCTPLVTSPGNVGINWTGLISTDWNNPCNWNPAWVPDATNSAVVINSRTNQPTISGTVPSVKLIYVNSGATLTVSSGGTLNASVSGTAGVLTLQGGNLINDGTINVSGGGSGVGISIGATASIINRGTINTNNLYGISCDFGNLTFTNESTGIVNGDFKANDNILTLTNHGTINYNIGSTYALSLGSAGSSVINNGTISITVGSGISNPSGSTITNNACGKILMTTDLYENGGTTTNAGLIQMPNLYNFTNTGTFTNNGVLKANTVSGITNNRMVITNACPIFTLAGSNNYTVSGIFTDAGATTSAGTYTSVGNKFTANNTIPTGTQTLYAQVTNGTCTFVVPFDFNNRKPTGVSISTTNICVGSNVTLSATCASGTVTWYGSAAATSPLGTGGTFNYVPSAGTGQAFYAACEATNCVSGRTITSNFVNVNSTPPAPTVTLTSAATVCQPATLNLTASGCAGTVTWSDNSTGTSLTISAAGTYNVSATCTVSGCTSVASSGNTGLVVNAPISPNPSSDSPKCVGTTLSFNSASGMSSYAWSGPNSFTSSIQAPSISNVSSAAAGTYTLTVTNGVCTATATTAVLINQSATATPTPSTQTICSASPITTIAITGTGSSYSWTRDNTTAVTGIAASGSGNISGSLTNTTEAPVTVTFTISALGSCSGTTTTASVVVNPIPTATASTPSQSICSGATITGIVFNPPPPVSPNVQLPDTSSDIIPTITTEPTQKITFNSAVVGTVFNWTRDNTTTVTGTIGASGSGNISGSLINTTASPVTVTFTVTPSYTNAGTTCTGTPITVTVTVNPNPIAPTITDAGTSFCSGSSTTLTASANPTYTSYAWQRSLSGIANPNSFTTFGGTARTQVITTSGVYRVIVTNQYNCSTSDTTAVKFGDIVYNGSLATGDAQQTGRMNRFGVVSTCAAPKSSPGDFTTTGARLYDSYTVTNPTSAPICATIGLSSNCGVNIFSVAYLGSFNPNSVGTNYLADPGSSFPATAFYEATIPANGTIVVVVHEVNTGTGCSGYNLRIDVPGLTVAPTASSNSPICAGNTLSLTGTGTGSGTPPAYSWSGPNNFTSTLQNPSIANATTLAAGTYTFNVTNTSGCVISATTAVTVNANPTATASSNSPVCVGNTLNFSTGTAASYSWNGPNSFSSTLQNPSILNVTNAANGTYTLVAANGSCSTTSTTSVTINALPVPNPTSNSPRCVGTNLTFNAVAGMTTYAWTGPNSFSSSIQAPSISNVTTAASGTYTLTVTNVSGCSASATTAVTINQALPPTITPPTSLSVCSPSTLTLTASGCAGIVTWSQGGSTGNSLTLSAVGTYSISATCTVNGCTSDASTSVTGLEIKAKPNAPTITPPTSLSVCSPSTLTLTASGCAGIVTWSQEAATGTSFTLSTVGTYSISATCTVNGCTSDASTTVTGLEIKAKPNAPTITPPTSLSVCSPSTLTLTASDCAGGTVVWSQGAATGTSLTLSTVGTYSVSATCTVGCTSDASTAVNGLEIKAKPNAPTITPPTSLSVCSPSTLTLTASDCAGIVTWSQGAATGTSLTLSTVGTYSISATCTVNGCTSDASTAITGLEIKAKPNAPTITSPTSLSVCSPSTLTLTASGCAGMVTWSQGAATGTSLTLSTVGTYSVSATCTIGCTSDASTAVNGLEIKAKPNAPTITSPTSLSVCSPSTLTLTASDCAGIVTWSQGAATGTSLTLSTVGTYSISATCTVNGCTSDASTSVTGLEIKATPIITATNTGPYTVGQTISLTGTGAVSYNWTGPNNFSSTSSTPTIPNALSVNGGIYTLSVTGVNGCNAVATTNVIVSGIDPCDPSRIVDYTYVKAGNPYQTLFPLTNGMIINQRTDQVSILVNPVCPSVAIESFEMNLQGPEMNWNILQNVSPYSLFDNFGLDVWGRNLKPGVYTLTVTGYPQDNKGGVATYGPKVTTFTIVGDLATINAPTLSKTAICAGSNVDVSFTTAGSFNGVNQFQVELSDSSGSFAAPVLIGTTNTTGTLNCVIPQSTLEGSKYLIRVTSTNQVVVGNPAMSLVTVHPFSYNLVSPTNNLTGSSTKKATSTINANNKVTSPASVTYQAGNSILLTPGFESGAVFKAEIQGCNN